MFSGTCLLFLNFEGGNIFARGGAHSLGLFGLETLVNLLSHILIPPELLTSHVVCKCNMLYYSDLKVKRFKSKYSNILCKFFIIRQQVILYVNFVF